MSDYDWRHDNGPRFPDPRMAIGQVPEQRKGEIEPTPTTVPVPASPDPDVELDLETEHIVRPFIVTGGRTRPVDDRLKIETMVHAAPAALSAPLGFERRRIVEICQRPVSVAEVSSMLGVPIGVARVLIADLIDERLLAEHEFVGFGAPLTRSLLERIREGVRAL